MATAVIDGSDAVVIALLGPGQDPAEDELARTRCRTRRRERK